MIATHGIMKSDLGLHSNLFGGRLLAWLDAAAAAYAMEYCESNRLVTVKIDECLFKSPGKEGQLLKIYAKVLDVGNTSVTLYLEARSHNVISGIQNVMLSTNFKFVRIDPQGSPNPISDKVKNKFKNN